MDAATQGMTIIATFALAHERVIEFVRWLFSKQFVPVRVRDLFDRLTAGPLAVIPAIALAYFTNANLLLAFQPAKDGQASPFFTDYLNGALPTQGSAIIGCLLMGLAVTLGSSFWHDLAKGLIDVRARVRDAKSPAKVLDDAATPQPPLAPELNKVVALDA
jgi:hypothetical protein